MLGSAPPVTASPQTSTSNVGATPTSPTRPSRLRGLTYLRNYAGVHLTPTRSAEDSRPRRTLSSGNENAAPLQTSSEGEQEISEAYETTTSSVHNQVNDSEGNMTRSRAKSAVDGPTPALVTAGTSNHPVPNRLATTNAETTISNNQPEQDTHSTTSTSMPGVTDSARNQSSIRFMPYNETRANRPSLNFVSVARTLKDSEGVVRVGRYSERDALKPGLPTSVPPIGFKSKVVSRRHCEFWCKDGQWYVKDVGSSSGTFLNHVRLSTPGTDSKPFPVRDGDLIQLGIDFKGGEEVIFRCVKMRVECNRGWQKTLNAFNTAQHRQLLDQVKPGASRADGAAEAAGAVGSSECSICLYPVAPCQALFIAPCGHSWHFRCISHLIMGHNYPNFVCPNCRLWADLSADPDPEEMQAPAAAQITTQEAEESENTNTNADMYESVRENEGRQHDNDGTPAEESEHGNINTENPNDSESEGDEGDEELTFGRTRAVNDMPAGFSTFNTSGDLLNPPNPWANPRHPLMQRTNPLDNLSSETAAVPARARGPIVSNGNNGLNIGSPNTPTNSTTFALSVMAGQEPLEINNLWAHDEMGGG